MLAEAASLIHCTSQEAIHFFDATDPTVIHGQLANRPSVFVADPSGVIQWCLGGRHGQLSLNAEDHGGMSRDDFLAAVLDGLCGQPDLIGTQASGGAGIANPSQLDDLLGFASAYALSGHPLSANRRL